MVCYIALPPPPRSPNPWIRSPSFRVPCPPGYYCASYSNHTDRDALDRSYRRMNDNRDPPTDRWIQGREGGGGVVWHAAPFSSLIPLRSVPAGVLLPQRHHHRALPPRALVRGADGVPAA